MFLYINVYRLYQSLWTNDKSDMKWMVSKVLSLHLQASMHTRKIDTVISNSRNAKPP